MTRTLLFLGLLVAPSAFADTSVRFPSPAPTNVIVLTAEQARGCFGWHTNEKFVSPTTADVKRVEASLARALGKIAANDKKAWWRLKAAEVVARLRTDVRYYYATADGYIRIEGFCAFFFGREEHTCPLDVDDGGSCVWRLFRS